MNIVRIQLISDLHLEFCKTDSAFIDVCNSIVNRAPIIVIAGDIGYPDRPYYECFLRHVSSKFNSVIIIHGNHEYYTTNREHAIEKTKSIVANISNIYFLENDFVDIEGFRFVGATLWTYIKNKQFLVNDKSWIQDFSVEAYNKIHIESRDFIASTISKSPLPVVVVSHHLPSYSLVDVKYQIYGEYNQCFASDSDDLLFRPVIAWLYGHTHTPRSSFVNGIPCYSNPIGYPGENKVCDFEYCVEISRD